MYETIMKSAIVFICLLIAAGLTLAFRFAPNEEIVLNFIKQNPTKSAILLIRNDSIVAQRNSDVAMPLASTVKILAAIEYAEQASRGTINPDEEISLSELNKYYIPNTDGNAHANWLKYVRAKIKDNKISIREIAKGMIMFSSNANTEWLFDRLGLKNINNQRKKLGLKHQSEVYYIVSALFVCKEAFAKVETERLAENLKKLSTKKYIDFTSKIHQKLKDDTLYKQNVGYLGMDVQRIWSDNLPAASVSDYVGIMQKINHRNYFDDKAQALLDEVMEVWFVNPKNREWLEHAGTKGGSTAFVLTKALYATDKKGNKTEMAYFLNDLTLSENQKLQASLNAFELKTLTDKVFLEKIKEDLK